MVPFFSATGRIPPPNPPRFNLLSLSCFWLPLAKDPPSAQLILLIHAAARPECAWKCKCRLSIVTNHFECFFLLALVKNPPHSLATDGSPSGVCIAWTLQRVLSAVQVCLSFPAAMDECLRRGAGRISDQPPPRHSRSPLRQMSDGGDPASPPSITHLSPEPPKKSATIYSRRVSCCFSFEFFLSTGVPVREGKPAEPPPHCSSEQTPPRRLSTG